MLSWMSNVVLCMFFSSFTCLFIINTAYFSIINSIPVSPQKNANSFCKVFRLHFFLFCNLCNSFDIIYKHEVIYFATFGICGPLFIYSGCNLVISLSYHSKRYDTLINPELWVTENSCSYSIRIAFTSDNPRKSICHLTKRLNQIYMNTHSCTHAHTHTHTHTHIYIYIYIYIETQTYINLHIYMCVCVWACE